jgi:hypothetical protein
LPAELSDREEPFLPYVGIACQPGHNRSETAPAGRETARARGFPWLIWHDYWSLERGQVSNTHKPLVSIDTYKSLWNYGAPSNAY